MGMITGGAKNIQGGPGLVITVLTLTPNLNSTPNQTQPQLLLDESYQHYPLTMNEMLGLRFKFKVFIQV